MIAAVDDRKQLAADRDAHAVLSAFCKTHHLKFRPVLSGILRTWGSLKDQEALFFAGVTELRDPTERRKLARRIAASLEKPPRRQR